MNFFSTTARGWKTVKDLPMIWTKKLPISRLLSNAILHSVTKNLKNAKKM